MKKRFNFSFVIPFIIVLLFFAGCQIRNPTDEEIRSTIEVVDVETKWVSKYYQPWPPKLILVPAITFRVRNITSEPLKYMNFNAIFKFKDEAQNLGDNFLAAIRGTPVMPGERSDLITLKSNFGVEGQSLTSFKNNPQWKLVSVKLFAQSRGSRHVLIGEWDVSRKIDFKEPETPGEEKKEDRLSP